LAVLPPFATNPNILINLEKDGKTAKTVGLGKPLVNLELVKFVGPNFAQRCRMNVVLS
jgi:hypothetical protein